MRRPTLARLLPCVALVALLQASCSQTPASVPLRSLERSGKLTLLCLDLASPGKVGYSLEDCQARRLSDAGNEVHLYAMVNQTTRGEVVLLDVPNTAVIDSNPASPGYNFLQVGALPIDIVTTPEATATFVATTEANRPGIYAMPSKKLLGSPSLTSWPACALPARPGAMTMLVAPHEGLCPGPNYAAEHPAASAGPTNPDADLSKEQQHPGARKLLVSLPTEGEMLVLDAQTILDRAPGSFDLCPIERRYKLDSALPDTVDLSSDPPPGDLCPERPAGSTADFCPVRKPRTVDYPSNYTSFPVAFAKADSVVYVADQKAPVIHAYDMADPCAPAQLPPLLPSSFDQPWRPVTTRALAVSPFTSDNKRFLYAVDDIDGSAMIFDITPGSGDRSPQVRSRPEYFPFSPRDRLNLGAPIQDITFVQQDYFPFDVGDGNKLSGVRCDPTGKDDGTPGRSSQFLPAPDLSDGAGPSRLRGVFGLVALSSGQLSIIDVDDYDAACRRANDKTDLPDWVTGCDDVPTGDPAAPCATSINDAPYATAEGTCRAVVRHEIRSRNYVVDNPTLGRHQANFPSPTLTINGASLLTDQDDSANEEAKKNPKLLGPLKTSKAGEVVDSPIWQIPNADPADPTPQAATRNFAVPDLRDPRAAISQGWSVTFEGPLPGTVGKVGRIVRADATPIDPVTFDPLPEGSTTAPDANATEDRWLLDPSGSFCYAGVHDTGLARLEGSRLLKDRADEAALQTFAAQHRDWFEVTNPLLDEEDPYWGSASAQCSYLKCRAFYGSSDAPTDNRSLQIVAAKNDQLRLRPPMDPQYEGGQLKSYKLRHLDPPPECCFPTLSSYQVRAGQTWVAAGTAVGFLHRTTLGDDGRCALLGVDSATGEVCDPSFSTRTGRIYEVPAEVTGQGLTRASTGRFYTDPYTFHNPYLHFLIYAGAEPSLRGMTFSWQTSGGFEPLEIGLGRGSVQVAPQSLFYHPALGTELLVTDGALQGVLSVDLYSLTIVRNFL